MPLKHLKHMFVTCAFSTPCYFGMEARRSVELTSGAELTAPVEKATTGLVEKVVVGPCTLEARGEQEAWWRGSKTACCTLARWRCLLAEWRRSGEGGTVRGRCGGERGRGLVETYRDVAVRWVFLERFGASE
jgi:hypothetical protein